MKLKEVITAEHLKLLDILVEHKVNPEYLVILDCLHGYSPGTHTNKQLLEIANIVWHVYLRVDNNYTLDSISYDIVQNYDEIKANCSDIMVVIQNYIEEVPRD